ncbi:alpha/beta hydrolase fold protein [Aspergillus sp. HF37]|nr:alpha/beta hydrolase fold protein [Aspergillus sp. HF37]
MGSQLAGPWRQFVNDLGESPALDGPYENLMGGWTTLLGKLMSRYSFPPPDPSVQTEDIEVSGIRVRTYIPPDVVGPSVALYLHGGGWVMGSVEEEDGFCRALSKLSGTKIVSVAYRLAPEFPFPRPLEDCVLAAEWAMDTHPSQSVAVVGTSAGGNLAFSTALTLIEKGLGDRVQGVVGLAPVTVHPDAVPVERKAQHTSYSENDRLTINTGSAMMTFFDSYGAPPQHPQLSCVLHPRLAELNKVYMAVGGADTLRDDVRLMQSALTEARVPVQCDEYSGYPHYSWLFPCPALKEHQGQFFGNLVRGVRWVFAR